MNTTQNDQKHSFLHLFFLLVFFISMSQSNSVFSQDINFKYDPVDSEISGRVSIGDINSDGFNDIVVHIWGSCRGMTPDGSLIWYEYPNWEKHYIQTNQKYFGDEITTVDIDKDGDMDILAPKGQATSANTCPGSIKRTYGEIYLYENLNGDGSEWVEHLVGLVDELSEVKDIHVDDLDKDGKLDIAVRASLNIVLFFQLNKTKWEKQMTGIVKREGSTLSDIDGDGYEDFVLNGYWLKNPVVRTDPWLRYNIDSLWFTSPVVDPPLNDKWRSDAVRVVAADLDNDGVDDLVFSHSEHKGFNVCWYKKISNPVTQETKAWEKHDIGIVDFAHSLQVADFDNNGSMDVFVGTTVWKGQLETPFNMEAGDIVVFKNDGSADFTRIKIDNKYVYAGVVGDIDNDNDVDIVAPRCWAESDNSFGGEIDLSSIQLWRNLHYDKQNLDQWTYKEIYTNRKNYALSTKGPAWLFGLDFSDVNEDNKLDIVAGRELHICPNDDINESWTTINLPLPESMDCGMFSDVNNDGLQDILGFDLQISGSLYWLEAQNTQGTSWSPNQITLDPAIPVPGHRNPQGYALAQMLPDGEKVIVIEAGDYITNDNGIYIIEVDYPATTWRTHKISDVPVGGNGLAVGDIDGDGLLDVFTGFKDLTEKQKGSTPGPYPVYWLKNPGNYDEYWEAISVDTLAIGHMPDRFAIADMDNDGKNDLILSEESYPITGGLSAWWYKTPDNPELANAWGEKNLIIDNGESFNSMEVTDMDGDGDNDVIIADMGLNQDGRLYIAENDAEGQFIIHKIHDGNESHGLRVADIDQDGDKDIVAIAWNRPSYLTLRLWINDYFETETEIEIEQGSDTLAFWNFDQLLEGVIPDISGSDIQLVLVGEADIEEGKMGNSLSIPAFQASFAEAEDASLVSGFPSGSKLSSTDSFTIAAWVKLNSIDERSPIITKEYKDKRGFEFAVKSGYLAAQVYKDELTGTKLESTGTLLEPNKWYHVAMTYKYIADESSQVGFYLDGQEDYFISNSTGPLKSNTAPLRIGAYIWSDSYQKFFNGKIDELYVFKTLLSEDQIGKLIANTYPDEVKSFSYNPSENLKIYPNPVISTVEFEFVVNQSGMMSLNIYNMHGQKVRILFNTYFEEGFYRRSYNMFELRNGLYLAGLVSNDKVDVRKFFVDRNYN